MKYLFFIFFALMLTACDERYRYPCQNPDNWEEKICKKPYCSANGTCPEDLTHYEKEKKLNITPQPQQCLPAVNTKGVCK